MVIERGQIYWVDLGDTVDGDHRPARRRPVLVVQSDSYNSSRLATVVVVSLTSNLIAAAKPGNVMLPAAEAGLPKDSVVNVTQLSTLNRYELLQPKIGQIGLHLLRQVEAGLASVLDLRLAT